MISAICLKWGIFPCEKTPHSAKIPLSVQSYWQNPLPSTRLEVGTAGVVLGGDPHTRHPRGFGLWCIHIGHNDMRVEVLVIIDELRGCVKVGAAASVSLPLVSFPPLPLGDPILKYLIIKGNYGEVCELR